MKAISNKILILGIVFFSFSTQLLAQPSFDDDTVDVPAAPIDEWIYPMLIIGILVFIRFKYVQMNQKKYE
jgi:hypothetical protein